MDHQEPELFDVIRSTLTEKGFLQSWQSELMVHAVKPLYETGVLPKVKVETEYQKVKLGLLMDLLKKLKMTNTRDMLLTEADAEGEYLDKGFEHIPAKEDEPYLSVFVDISREKKNPPQDDLEETQDFFTTAIDLKDDDKSILEANNTVRDSQ